MTKNEIQTLLMDALGLNKEPVALKPLKVFPSDIPAYEGVATPGLCAQINEILSDGTVFYSTKKNHVCFEGLITTGVCEIDREEYRKAYRSLSISAPTIKTCKQPWTSMKPVFEKYPCPRCSIPALFQAP